MWRLELATQFGQVRKGTVVGMLVLVVALLLLIPPALEKGVQPEADVFVADASGPFAQALREDARFRVVDEGGISFARGEADVWLHDGELDWTNTVRSKAAAEAVAQAVDRWLGRQLQDEPNQDAAFPVQVTIAYAPRDVGTANAEPAPTPQPGNQTNESAPEPTVQDRVPGARQDDPVPPAKVDPPFPMRSLLLTFAYMIPMNLLGQNQAGSLLKERTAQRGLILLSGPVSGARILWTRSLPHIGAAMALAAVVTVAIGSGLLGFLAALSFLFFLLAAAMVLGLTSRNLRELTYLQVGLTTGTSVFLFLPAAFTALPAVAFLSPVHVVASGIRNESVPLEAFLYAVLPIALAGVALAVLATRLYREETLFAEASPGTTAWSGLQYAIKRWPHLLLGGALVVPFAYAAEIILLVFAVSLDLRIAFVAFLIIGAVVEELAKGAVVLAGPRKWWSGILVGGGFFLAEKLALLLALAGFADLPFGGGLAAFGAAAGFLLVGPLLLHIGTASITANIRRYPAVGLILAMGVHLAYNAIVIGVGT